MYPKEFFLDRFKDDETQDLLMRYATADLADAAREAILDILSQRGVSEEKLSPLIKQEKIASYRQTNDSSYEECLVGYVQVKKDPKIDKWINRTVWAMLIMAGCLYLMGDASVIFSSWSKIFMLSLVFGVFGALSVSFFLARFLRRCQKCHSRLKRFCSATKQNEFFVICETCKTFFREVEDGL